MHPRYVVTACVLFVFGCVADAVGEGLLWLIGNPQADVVTLSVLATAISGAALLGIGALADAYGASGRRECNLQALLALLWLSPNRPTQRVDADLYWKAVGRGAPVNAADAVVPLLSLSLIGGILLPLWLMTS